MGVDKINPFASLAFNETDELIAVKRKNKKKEESVIVSEKLREESVSVLLDDLPPPEMPNLDMIRHKIMNNEYQVDYEKLAEKMIELEKLWIE